MSPAPQPIQDAANLIAEGRDADVFLYHGAIYRPTAIEAISAIRGLKCKRKNVFLVIVTDGGDADAAYMIMRCFQNNYENVIFAVPSLCKSAGTIMALGANEIVMSDYGELGPLDVQLTKEDDLWSQNSGLTATESVSMLRSLALETFDKSWRTIKKKTYGQVSFKLAADLAQHITVGLFAPIFEQLQAMHFGEAGRANQIAVAYGKNLDRGNIKEQAIEKLAVSCPSHTFVIDREAAREYFDLVESPSDLECDLFEKMQNIALGLHRRGEEGNLVKIIEYISAPIEKVVEGGTQDGQQLAGVAPAEEERTDRAPSGNKEELGDRAAASVGPNGAAAAEQD